MKVVAAVDAVFAVGAGQIAGPSRVRPVVRARWVAWQILRDNARLSLPQIGNLFACDHTTVIHGLRALADAIEVDPDLGDKAARAAEIYRGEKPAAPRVLFVPWTTAEHDLAVSMDRGGAKLADIARHLGRTEAAVRERLRAHREKNASANRRNPRRDAPPPEDPGRPFADNLRRCEALWAAALDGSGFQSMKIAERPMVLLDRPDAQHVGAEIDP